MATNHSPMIGPKKRPTRAVPQRWTANSASRIATAPGTTISFSPGSRISRPSIEDSTEMAGVIMLSPKNSAAPKMPTEASTPNALVDSRLSASSASSASRPPSPSLSVRMNVSTYITVTITVIDQNTSEMAP